VRLHGRGGLSAAVAAVSLDQPDADEVFELPAMILSEHAAYVHDAREAFALYESIPTKQLLQLKAAFEIDITASDKPETIAFGAGRIALIAAVLGTRGIRQDHETVTSFTCPTCQRVTYNANDITHRYCSACHQFHDEGSAR
jgi:hypothetical protein